MEQQKVTDKMKEWCACTTMRDMLFEIVKEENISYEQALLNFAKSKTYKMLFDFDTAVWKEGPVYLQDLYQKNK